MSTLFITIVFVVSLISLSVLIFLRIRDLRNGKLEPSDVPHYDSSLFISILSFLKKESVTMIRRGIQISLMFIVKLWILLVHKVKTFIKKNVPMLKSRKHVWEQTGTVIFHNFNEYRAKIRRFKRHIDQKESEILDKTEVIGNVEKNEVDEKENIV